MHGMDSQLEYGFPIGININVNLDIKCLKVCKRTGKDRNSSGYEQ